MLKENNLKLNSKNQSFIEALTKKYQPKKSPKITQKPKEIPKIVPKQEVL